MIGDAYFQLRAQVGTALFTLLRLATEAGSGDGALTQLRSAQAGLKETFLFMALGPAGGGKSSLLNALFEREFCGAAEPATAGKTAVYEHADEPRDEAVSQGVIVCHRPHIFLRDFTIVDGAGLDTTNQAMLEHVAPFLSRAEVIFFVVPAASTTVADYWTFLLRLGRDALRRTVVVVWQSDRGLPEEGANAVKRLRQAMLKNLGHACPIFAASGRDRPGREKLGRWIESEVIFSKARRTRLAEIDRLARNALEEIAGKPHATEQTWQRMDGQLRGLREDLIEREDQSQRQIAGVLWTLAQTFDALRLRGESLLAPCLGVVELVRGRGAWAPAFAAEIETQARESLNVQTEDALDVLEDDLRQGAKDHRQASHKLLPGDAASPPFSRAALVAAIKKLDTPLELQRLLAEESAQAALLLRLPVLAALGALAVLLGVWPVAGMVPACAALTAGTAAFALLLAYLLRKSLVASFGRHFTTNRASLLTAIEVPLREASTRFYAALAAPLDARIEAHATERQGHEPLLTRVEQLQQTFGKISEDLRTGRTPNAADADAA